MMGDYVKRSDTLQAVGDIHPLDYNGQGIVERIKAIPAADVVEVRHERWKDIGIIWLDKDNMPDGISTMFCPVCERYATKVYLYGDPVEMMNYCPSCGAKMDGGQDDV